MFPGSAHHESSEVFMVDKKQKCHDDGKCQANANQVSLDSLLPVIVANVFEKGFQNDIVVISFSANYWCILMMTIMLF